MLVAFDGEMVAVKGDALQDLDFAYAITVHKSQGSQYPSVLLPLYPSAGRLRSRAMLYTALTRAQALAIVIGEMTTISQAVNNLGGASRVTGFPAHLAEARGGDGSITQVGGNRVLAPNVERFDRNQPYAQRAGQSQ